ncbi:dienelactone hydrolase family protein [Catellatospora sp. KI3]|uniref:dienelactone hydrolase family protein n=1 Tax=Catellatospora sp. KI3 TaxID=3041620 RepID=UPI002482F49A|nr:dienelactone hydrolase family protein [Catellatospora sp. KI3]MDI1465969.1 dienelactone hydrolase family protein [Catellatospora sp. KI3]
MCHSDDSVPPSAPDAGAVAGHGPLELAAADGNRFAAYQATPAVPNGASMVILPDVRGLHPFYIRLAQRFAEAGYQAVAMDYFGRTAGVSQRDESFAYTEHLPSLTPDQVKADAAAAVAAVRAANPDGPVFTVGFCYGGSSSWRLAAADLGLSGVIGFYGRPDRVYDVVDEMHAPLLLLIAGDDAATPLAEFEKFAATLESAGKPFEMHVYDGAPHSFFDRSYDQWADACTDAWHRILTFTTTPHSR